MTKSRIPSLSKAEIAAIADRAEGRDPLTATAAERGEYVSIEDLARLTGYDRGTIREWIDAGLPAGPGGRGIPYSINVREFVEWRMARAAASAKPAVAPGSEYEWMGLTKPKEIFQAQLALMKAAEKAKEVVPRAYVVDVLSRVLNAIRVATASLPDRLFREMSGFPPELVLKWRDMASEIILDALAAGQASIDKAMADLADPDDDDAEPVLD
jgi:phage terminase Nu1 subunit (DNA packaging protein)